MLCGFRVWVLSHAGEFFGLPPAQIVADPALPAAHLLTIVPICALSHSIIQEIALQPTTDDVRVVLLGDTAVGKTSLRQSYTQSTFPRDHVATVFETVQVEVIVDGTTIKVGLYDTAGQEQFDQLRSQNTAEADVNILCFSLVSRNSLGNLRRKWKKEVPKDSAFIVVGTKSDMVLDADGDDIVNMDEVSLFHTH